MSMNNPINIIRSAILSSSLLLTLSAPAAASSVFSGFEGAWRGKGAMSLNDGSRETLRCRASYVIGSSGDALTVDVNCKSNSYSVHIVADVVAQGTTLSGSWQEMTRQVNGTITGRIPRPDEMQASFEAMGGGLQLGARTNGRILAITINSQGSEIQSISLLLKR